MMTAVDRYRKYVPESQRYYEKKRGEGKNTIRQSVRSAATSAESFTRCSPNNESTNCTVKRGIPKPGSLRDRALKRKYGSRKFQRRAKNRISTERVAITMAA
jgi:hypothetical protein